MSTVTDTITQTLPTLSLRSTKPKEEVEEPERGRSTKPKWFGETGKPASEYKYARYLPTFDAHLKLPPLEPFEHVDPGHQALSDPEPQAFLKGAEVEELTPQFGSDVSGIQLHKLDKRGREQLALWVAQRGVVAFRDQDFIDQDPEWLIKNWGAFFGRPHIHPTSGAPEGFPEFHLVL